MFAEALCGLAKDNDRIAAITAAMTSGTGLEAFKKLYPERFFDVGIAEQHAVTMAAGMAASGVLPVFCVYSSFLQRAYDQLLHDVCLQGLKVVFGIDRAGLVGADGETHHGIYDIAYLLSLPNMTVLSPSSRGELAACLEQAVKAIEGPCAIRYNRGILPERAVAGSDMLKWEFIAPVRPVTVVATGRMVAPVLEACEGLEVGICSARAIRPMDESALMALRSARQIVTVEDGVVNAGFGVQLAAYMSENSSGCAVTCIGVPNRVIEQGTVAQQDEECGMDAGSIRKLVVSLIDKNRDDPAEVDNG